MFRFFSFLGDRARYPFKLRGKPLVTIPIVVAELRTGKTHSTSMNASFPFINPVTPPCGTVDGFTHKRHK